MCHTVCELQENLICFIKYVTFIQQGAEWLLIAQHDPVDFLRPKRVAYEIPQAAKGIGMQFRWWQPVHDGQGHDQWAIDHVEIIS